ncbi:MAG TPA: nuclear transport factor 2 family protein [Pyrinomonadaceae bacterium]|nr:nuclear transport factor 2 family protein [Pyrinomonadaceae bacterium]
MRSLSTCLMACSTLFFESRRALCFCPRAIEADAVALDRIYADDFIGIGPSGRVRTKAQVISDFTSGDLKFQSITTDDVRVRVYGNTAVENGRSTMIEQDRGKAVPRDNRFTRVWIKQVGRWRLVSNHYSSLIPQ